MVQRGIGSIRQDVNVSIRGGARIEMKGLQEIESVDEIIDNEVQRQVNLIEIKKELLARKAEGWTSVDVTHIFQTHRSKDNLRPGLAGRQRLRSQTDRIQGILGKGDKAEDETGHEISDYAKMAEVKGIIHSDENLDSYKMTAKELEDVEQGA